MGKRAGKKRKERNVRKGCFYGFLVFFALLGAVISGGYFSARHYVRRGMTAAEIAEMNRFFEEPVELPEEWRKLPPVPEDVREAAERALALRKDLQNNVWMQAWWKLMAGVDLDRGEWKAVEDVADRHREFADALAFLVNTDGYTMNALGETTPDVSEFISVQQGAKLLATRSYLLARDGDWEGSLNTAANAVKIARRPTGSQLYVHLIAFACEGIGARCIALLAPRCDDRGVLRDLLDEMNRLDSEINLDAVNDPLLLDIAGELRYYARSGYSVDLSSKAPRGYFYGQLIELDRRTGRNVHEFNSLASWKKSIVTRSSAHFRPAAEELYRLSRRWVSEDTEKREHVAEALFDLARLAVASRLYELENGGAAGSTADLVPAYFDEELVDPFSGKPYQLEKEHNTFYSLGPGAKDESATVQYNPTNGTVSAGDIFVRGTARGR